MECSGKQVVIFGGGEVAARKAGHFAQEADVFMISRTFSPSCRALPIELRTLDTRSATDDEIRTLIQPAFLVIGALSDRQENDRIGALCRDERVLFNNADGKPGDVVIPAITAGEHYTIAVSTGSESPAVSRFIREEIEKNYPSLDAMVVLQHQIRDTLRERRITPEIRRQILWNVLRDKAIWALLPESPGQAWDRVCERYLHE